MIFPQINHITFLNVFKFIGNVKIRLFFWESNVKILKISILTITNIFKDIYIILTIFKTSILTIIKYFKDLYSKGLYVKIFKLFKDLYIMSFSYFSLY